MNARFIFSGLAFSLALLVSSGCDRGTTTHRSGPTKVEVDHDGAKVDINRPNMGTKRPVEVEVKPGGGVDVDIDRDAIRDRVEERREERRDRTDN